MVNVVKGGQISFLFSGLLCASASLSLVIFHLISLHKVRKITLQKTILRERLNKNISRFSEASVSP